MERISRESFIRLGAALGVGAAAASLAACGGGSQAGSSGGGNSGGGDSGGGSGSGSAVGQNTPAASGSGGADGQAAATGSGGSAIARESEVSPGSAVKFKDGGQDAVLVHLDSGDFVAYSAVCTHQGCTVAYRDGQLACPCHGSIFDPASGAEVVTGPAQRPLPEIPVRVQNGEVLRA